MGHDIIVMGASAGGVQALSQLLGGLPRDLPAAVLIVQHTSPAGPGLLAQVLGRGASLPVANAIDGEQIRSGRVYVAPPDQHLIVQGSRLNLSAGPRENRQRPAIDALFRSAAHSYRSRTIGVVLTGYLDDGTAGLAAIKTNGGIAVVQDPDDAEAPGMPRSALRYVPMDYRLPLLGIAPLLVRLAAQPSMPEHAPSSTYLDKSRMSPEEMTVRFGPPTGVSCPECNGSLWETTTGRALQFRCHVGHLYSPESLLVEQSQGLESTLWSVVRALDDQAALLRRLAKREDQPPELRNELEDQARHCEERADSVRALLKKD